MSKKRSPSERPKPEFPATELKQVIIRASYYPENPEEVKEIEETYRIRGKLKEGEVLQEKYPWMHDIGKEKYIHTNVYYCYNEVKVEDRERCYYNENLRFRVYDKEGQMIAEDCLRVSNFEDYDENGRYSEAYLEKANTPHIGGIPKKPVTAEEGILEGRAILLYLPYDENRYETRIVRLEGEKEIIIKSSFGSSPITKSELIEYYDGREYLNLGI